MDTGTVNQRYNCVCSAHNFGLPHIVSTATWYRHLQEAPEEERQRMRDSKHDGLVRPTRTRARGTASRRRNRVLPIQNRALPERHSSSPGIPSDHSPSRSYQAPSLSPERRLPSPEPMEFGQHSPGGASSADLPSPQSNSSVPRSGSPAQDSHPLRALINYQHRPQPVIEVETLSTLATFKPMQETMQFIRTLRNASTSDPDAKLSSNALDRLLNPPALPLEINDPAVRHSISTYLALENASQAAYESVARSLKHNFPHIENILTFHQVESLISTYTGIEPVLNDMCPNTCIAFTGPYSKLDECPLCEAPRWNQAVQGTSGRTTKVPMQQFTTIPIGPQLQARNRSRESARAMRYLWEKSQEILRSIVTTRSSQIPIINDIVMGWDFLGAVLDGHIKKDDIVLIVSLDGAQLFDSKESDCWIYIWIICNLSPDVRYRKLNVLPGGFIPGPKKPKNVDSFLFPGMHHLAAIQREGLSMWDPLSDSRYSSNVYLLFTTADGPGLVYWDGMVGHSGKNGCRLYCGLPGRRKERAHRYYPALLCPRDHAVEGSNHADLDVFDLPSAGSSDYPANLKKIVAVANQTQWDKMKTDTGLTKPPLILGLQPRCSLGVPLCMTTDIMHLAGNISDLLITLWRAEIDVGAGDDKSTWDWAVLREEATWTSHGKDVAAAGTFLPGSYDRKPRNIAEKINTQYKTWEFQLYTFGIAPILLYDLLPLKYWSHYCQLVRGFQIICQYSMTHEQLVDAHTLLCIWERDFELLYYQLRQDRIHFVRPAVHQVIHLVPEAIQKGPPICYAQWTMERTIGNLGQQIRQPSKPYANLAQEGVRRAQVNALLSAIPELDVPPKGLPRGSVDLGDGYVLLRKRSKYPVSPDHNLIEALQNYLPPGQQIPRFDKWARLRLPTGQIARSAWREVLKSPDNLRISRNVKFIDGDKIRVGEVQYFTRLAIQSEGQEWSFADIAILKRYSEPDSDLLRLSSQVLAASLLLDEIFVCDIKNIRSVVAMIPRTLKLPSGIEDRFFCMMEKPGVDISDIGVPYSIYAEGDDEGNEGEDVDMDVE